MGRKKSKAEPEQYGPPEWLSWEPEWLSGTDVEAMCKIRGGLEYHAGFPISHRKWRLFAVACL
jgi:hypothetical protein